MERPLALVARTGFGFGIFLRDVSTAPGFSENVDSHGAILVSPSMYAEFIYKHAHTHRLVSLHTLPVCCPGCMPLSVCFSCETGFVDDLVASTRFFEGFLNFWTPAHASRAYHTAMNILAYLSSHPSSVFFHSA